MLDKIWQERFETLWNQGVRSWASNTCIVINWRKFYPKTNSVCLRLSSGAREKRGAFVFQKRNMRAMGTREMEYTNHMHSLASKWGNEVRQHFGHEFPDLLRGPILMSISRGTVPVVLSTIKPWYGLMTDRSILDLVSIISPEKGHP